MIERGRGLGAAERRVDERLSGREYLGLDELRGKLGRLAETTVRTKRARSGRGERGRVVEVGRRVDEIGASTVEVMALVEYGPEVRETHAVEINETERVHLSLEAWNERRTMCGR